MDTITRCRSTVSCSLTTADPFSCIHAAAPPCSFAPQKDRSFTEKHTSLMALGYMTEQLQFSIGDDVQYVSSSKYAYRAPGTYRVVRLRPSETPDCQYWIRSSLENFDRIACQSELGLIAPTSTKRVATQFITILVP